LIGEKPWQITYKQWMSSKLLDAVAWGAAGSTIALGAGALMM
jgi:hypothetical protein